MHSNKKTTAALLSLSVVVSSLLVNELLTGSVTRFAPHVLTAPLSLIETASNVTMTDRIAHRLSDRVQRRFGVQPPLTKLRTAVATRQDLLQRAVEVNMPIEGGNSQTGELVWTLSMQPDWITFSASKQSASFSMDKSVVTATLNAALPLGLPAVKDAYVSAVVTDKYGVQRIETPDTAKAGYEYVDTDSVKTMVSALASGDTSISVPLRYRSGEFISADGSTPLVLLASGTSDYRTSPWGRQENVKKSIQQHVNRVFVPQGATFSFNATLGGPVSKSNGWFDSLIIVNGSSLEPAPGGGICQAATTVYRAAVLSGLPIVKRAPHSLYVHYYEMYGLGLDATIFPGAQDLTFRNDTPGNIIVQASTEGTGVTVEFYGVPDGREVAMEGPYVGPGTLEGLDRPMRSNEIGWVQSITRQDGTEERRTIVSAYGKMPRTTAQKVALTPEAQPVALPAEVVQNVAFDY